jgi:hypothetical protein
MPALIYEKKGRVAHIILNRPEARNAMNAEVWDGLVKSWVDFRDDPEIWVAIVTGAGKGIGSGYTSLGAVIIHEKVYDLFLESGRSSFAMGYTYSGNPLSCAVGLAVLRYLKRNALVARAAEMGAFMFKQFESFKKFFASKYSSTCCKTCDFIDSYWCWCIKR